MRKPINAFFLAVAFSFCLFLFPQIAWSQKSIAKEIISNGASIFKKVSPSVVVVRGTSNNSEIQGSGVAYKHGARNYEKFESDLTWVVTNAHVVKGSNLVKVESQGKTYPAEIVYADSEIDIALLIVPDAVLPIIKIAGANKVIVGDRVFAIGSPLGLENSITEGIVSGIRKFNGIKLLQTSAAISKGSSGGGLFNTNGLFVGITTFKIASGESLNFAIDAQYAESISKAWLAAGIVSSSYENLMSPALVKWMLTKSSPDGDPMYLYIHRNFDKALKSKSIISFMEKMEKEIVQQYVSENERAAKSSSAPIFRLACPLYFIHGGEFVREIMLEIDESKSLVNGSPVQFSESIIFFTSNGYKYTLNRYTATLTASDDKATIATGKCVKVDERKF